MPVGRFQAHFFRNDMNDFIYLDSNATTQVAPEVFEAMAPYFTELYGNPSSSYRFGKQTAAAVTKSREQIAALLGCEPREIIFTSCGTESDNAAIASALQTTGKRHIVTSHVEHSAIKNQCEHLERLGHPVTHVPVRADGTITVDDVAKALRPDTAIVSLMWANNETGVLFPIEEIAALCEEKGVLFHTDAVQAVGKIPINLKNSKIHFLSVSGHKLHAPKGVGVLYVRRRTAFVPFLIGGQQEKGRRGGTENTASIVALGRAAELAIPSIDLENTKVRALRDKLEKGILSAIPDCAVNGNTEHRLPNTTNIAFGGTDAGALLAALDANDICASAGSACTSGSLSPSHVLQAMGVPTDKALSSLRFSLSIYNTETEIDRVLEVLPGIVSQIRAASGKPEPVLST
jgi:cysteine desulfurase